MSAVLFYFLIYFKSQLPYVTHTHTLRTHTGPRKSHAACRYIRVYSIPSARQLHSRSSLGPGRCLLVCVCTYMYIVYTAAPREKGRRSRARKRTARRNDSIYIQSRGLIATQFNRWAKRSWWSSARERERERVCPPLSLSLVVPHFHPSLLLDRSASRSDKKAPLLVRTPISHDALARMGIIIVK